VENLLLDENEILDVTRSPTGLKCPYTTAQEVNRGLQQLVLSEAHLKSYTKSLLDTRLAKLARDAQDAVYKQKGVPLQQPKIPEHSDIEEEARKVLKSALENGTWRSKCKGRDILKAYCGQHGLKYEHFRNSLIARMKIAPKALADIMDKILES
jgi:hypothetical protein